MTIKKNLSKSDRIKIERLINEMEESEKDLSKKFKDFGELLNR